MSDSAYVGIMRPVRQKSWGPAAVANFWLGGMASGAYIIAVIALADSEHALSGLFQLLLLFLIGTGFLLLALHVGKPERARFAAWNLRSSWMARETAAGLLFLVTAVWYFLFASALAGWLAAFTAVLFLISQSFILYRGQGVFGWDIATVPAHFTLSSFSSGAGLLLLAAPFRTVDTLQVLAVISLIFVILNLAVWLLYIYKTPISHKPALSSLRKTRALVLIVGVGMLLPFFLLLSMVFQLSGGKMLAGWMRIYEIVIGLSLIGGVLLQKYSVVMIAGWRKQ